MQFTPAQQQAIDLDGHIVVTAGAGSGKTRVLVERYLRLLVKYADPDQAGEPPPLLAITFTEKAAREMRERVRTAVEQRLRDAPPPERTLWEYLRDAVEAARISTIHSFCTALLRSQPVETGLDPQFTVLDEVEAGCCAKPVWMPRCKRGWPKPPPCRLLIHRRGLSLLRCKPN